MKRWLLALLLAGSAAAVGGESGAGAGTLSVEVPDWVEDGAFVPLTVRLAGARAPVEVTLRRDGEPDPRIARVVAYRWREPLEFSTRVRLPQSQVVEVVARDAEGQEWRVREPVRIAASSCLTPPSGDPLAGLGEARAWQRKVDGGIELVSLLRHPMETGRRDDAAGNRLPRRLLQGIHLEAEGQPLMDITPHEGLAANPYWRLLLDPKPVSVSLTWIDEDGTRYHQTSQLTAP